jgi:hypothetical protein
VSDHSGPPIRPPEADPTGWTQISDIAVRKGSWVIAKLRTGGRLVFRAWRDMDQFPAFHDASLAKVKAFVESKESNP